MLVDGDGAGDGVDVEEVHLEALGAGATEARDGGRRHRGAVGGEVVGPAARVLAGSAGVLHVVARVHREGRLVCVKGVALLGERVGVVLVGRNLPGIGDGAGVALVGGGSGAARVAQLALGQRGVARLLGGEERPRGVDLAALPAVGGHVDGEGAAEHLRDGRGVAGEGLGHLDGARLCHELAVDVPAVAVGRLEHVPLEREVVGGEVVGLELVAVHRDDLGAGLHERADLGENLLVGGEVHLEGVRGAARLGGARDARLQLRLELRAGVAVAEAHRGHAAQDDILAVLLEQVEALARGGVVLLGAVAHHACRHVAVRRVERVGEVADGGGRGPARRALGHGDEVDEEVDVRGVGVVRAGLGVLPLGHEAHRLAGVLGSGQVEGRRFLAVGGGRDDPVLSGVGGVGHVGAVGELDLPALERAHMEVLGQVARGVAPLEVIGGAVGPEHLVGVRHRHDLAGGDQFLVGVDDALRHLEVVVDGRAVRVVLGHLLQVEVVDDAALGRVY